MHTHSLIISALGTKALRDLGASHQQICNWRRRGISWRYRPHVADIAKAQNIDLPADFLTPEMAG